jgi:hypothetical protein
MNSGQDEYPHIQSSGWRRDFQAVVEHQHILEVPDRQTQVPSSFSYQVWCRNRWTFQAKGRIGLRGESFWTSGAGTVCGVYHLFQMGFFEIRSDKPDRKASYRRLITTCFIKGADGTTSVQNISEEYSVRKDLRKCDAAGNMWHTLAYIKGESPCKQFDRRVFRFDNPVLLCRRAGRA